MAKEEAAIADAAKIAEQKRLEAEKKLPKLGDFDVNRAPSSFVEARISAFAQKKIDSGQYCPLWPFITAGLAEVAAAVASSGDDASSIRLGRTDDNRLTVQSGPSACTHKNMIRDPDVHSPRGENRSRKRWSETARAGAHNMDRTSRGDPRE